MADSSENQQNVVSLAEARKRQKTVRSQAAARDKKTPAKMHSVWGYIQLLLFLAVVAYMMQLCRSGA